MKAEGVTAGVFDKILLIPRNGYGALCLEAKTPRGRISASQKEWQQIAEKAGNKCVVYRSFEEFRAIIQEYLK